MTLNVTAKKLNDCCTGQLLYGRYMALGNVSYTAVEFSTLLLDSTLLIRETIKSNGQCSYSQMKETYSEAINSKLKDLPQLPSQFTKTIFDRQQCAGMIHVLRTYRYFMAN